MVEANIYHHDLYKWLGEGLNHSYVEDVYNEMDIKQLNFFALLQHAQVNHKIEIYSIAFNLLKELIE